MELTLVWVFLSIFFGFISYGMLLYDIFWGDTRPHLYTFLIWTITQATATFALKEGHAGWAILPYVSGTIFVFVVFCISHFRGTKDVARFDLGCLIAALLGVGTWYVFDSPFAAVLIVTSIDLVGFIPTLRKSWHNPWEESLKFWLITGLSGLFFILALEEHNRLTLTYSLGLDGGIAVLIILCLIRRRTVKRPSEVSTQK